MEFNISLSTFHFSLHGNVLSASDREVERRSSHIMSDNFNSQTELSSDLFQYLLIYTGRNSGY